MANGAGTRADAGSGQRTSAPDTGALQHDVRSYLTEVRNFRDDAIGYRLQVGVPPHRTRYDRYPDVGRLHGEIIMCWGIVGWLDFRPVPMERARPNIYQPMRHKPKSPLGVAIQHYRADNAKRYGSRTIDGSLLRIIGRKMLRDLELQRRTLEHEIRSYQRNSRAKGTDGQKRAPGSVCRDLRHAVAEATEALDDAYLWAIGQHTWRHDRREIVKTLKNPLRLRNSPEERHLRYVLREYMAHYDEERYH